MHGQKNIKPKTTKSNITATNPNSFGNKSCNGGRPVHHMIRPF